MSDTVVETQAEQAEVPVSRRMIVTRHKAIIGSQPKVDVYLEAAVAAMDEWAVKALPNARLVATRRGYGAEAVDEASFVGMDTDEMVDSAVQGLREAMNVLRGCTARPLAADTFPLDDAVEQVDLAKSILIQAMGVNLQANARYRMQLHDVLSNVAEARQYVTAKQAAQQALAGRMN